MGKGVDSDIVKEIMDIEPTALLELYQIYYNYREDNQAVLHFHGGTNGIREKIYFNDQEYLPIPVETEDFELLGDQKLPRPKIKVSNAGLYVSSLLRQFDNLNNAKFIRKRVFAKFLDDRNFPNNQNPWGQANPSARMPDEKFFVSRKISENKLYVEFELISSLEFESIEIPSRTVASRYCPFFYRGEGCRYGTGSDIAGDGQDRPVADVNDRLFGLPFKDELFPDRFGAEFETDSEEEEAFEDDPNNELPNWYFNPDIFYNNFQDLQGVFFKPSPPSQGREKTRVTINGTDYVVHTFRVSDNFTLPQQLDIEYLIVAGGGGGGNGDDNGGGGGGGGAGGLISSNGLVTQSAGNYPIIVGKGGKGTAAGSGARGQDGENSSAFGQTAIGGGGGGMRSAGSDGGSGGGASRDNTGGSGAAGQGNDGGDGRGGPARFSATAGGGGGAGQVGEDGGSPATNGGDGDGGDGLPSDITGPIDQLQKISKGLFGKRYDGYFSDNVNFFTESKLDGAIDQNRTQLSNFSFGDERYSWQWMGYFIPTVSGTWTFYTGSDDASYLWIGNNALSGFSTSNALVKNGGLHPFRERSGSISLTAGEFYPIRIQYGENTGADRITVSFAGPNISKRSNGNGFFYNGRELWNLTIDGITSRYYAGGGGGGYSENGPAGVGGLGGGGSGGSSRNKPGIDAEAGTGGGGGGAAVGIANSGSDPVGYGGGDGGSGIVIIRYQVDTVEQNSGFTMWVNKTRENKYFLTAINEDESVNETASGVYEYSEAAQDDSRFEKYFKRNSSIFISYDKIDKTWGIGFEGQFYSFSVKDADMLKDSIYDENNQSDRAKSLLIYKGRWELTEAGSFIESNVQSAPNQNITSERIYEVGDYVYLTTQKIALGQKLTNNFYESNPTHYVCRRRHTASPQNRPDKNLRLWAKDSCSKKLSGCKLRFDNEEYDGVDGYDNLNSARNLPFGGFPGTDNYEY